MRTVVLIVLAAAVVLTTAGFAVFRGFGSPDVPAGDVAVVQGVPNPPGEDVTQAEYRAALLQAAAQQGLRSLPKPGTAQFSQVKDAALSNVLLERWIEGEAADRGITVSSSQVADRLQQIIKTQFGNSQKQFEQFKQQAHFTQQQALEQVRLQLISNEVQSQVLPQNASSKVPTDTAKNYYEANITQFQQPETRDFRLILNKDQAKVQQAVQALQSDDSAANWKQVAKKFSTDPTTRSVGGLRSGVAQGQSEPALDKQLFAAPLNQIVGPFKGQSGFYAIEVQADHPASTQPFDKVQSQIQQQLASLKQQQIAQNFQNSFTSKWTAQTYCAPAFVTTRCANYQAPAATGGGAVVPSIKPVEPGHAAVFFSTPQGLPQGPITQSSAAGPTIPGGSTIPLGPAGTPSAPPGAPPPGG